MVYLAAMAKTSRRVFFIVVILICTTGSIGYLNEIKDVVANLRQYLHSGLEGLAKVAQTLENVEKFVDATIDEDCDPFICPTG